MVALFTDDAVVFDERQTWSGSDGIRAWRDGPASRYQYTTELADVTQTGEDHYRATGRIEGNFPGGTAQLNWDFTLTGERISRLEIAPLALRLEDEDLDRQVGVDVVGAHEGDHLSVGDLLDRRTGLRRDRVLIGAAHRVDLFLAVALDEVALALGQRVLQDDGAPGLRT